MSTVEAIRERILKKFPDNYDKGIGTVLWDICQAYAMDFEEKYKEIELSKNNFFLANIKDEEGFDLKIGDYGEKRKEACFASGTITIEGKAGTQVNKGTLVASDLIEYETLNTLIIPKEEIIDIPIKCVKEGKIGNATIGVINKFPLTLKGLHKCYNTKGITNGVDREEIEEARNRVQEKIREPRTSGNKFDYKYWAKSVDGVGNARVIPRWNGVNTVKVYISDRNNDIATEELIQETLAYIENIRPLVVDVCVESAKLKMVDVKIKGLAEDINANQTPEQIKVNIKETLRKYINSVSLDDTLISYAHCNRAVLDTEGVGDFLDLELNGVVGPVRLMEDQIGRFNKLIIDGEEI